MKKQGFTLVELIGVITILGIIILIVTPAIRKLTKDSKTDLYNVQIHNIEEGLKNWAIDNSTMLPKKEGEVITLTLGQLKMGGYVDSDIKNPKNNQCFSNDMALEIKRYQKNYIYTVNDTTGTDTTTCDDYTKPYIIMNGEVITYVEVNDVYVEQGVSARDAMGNDVTSNVSMSITGSGNSIDTAKVGNKYTITYTVTVSGETTSVNRTVIVRDSISPNLIVPENVVIKKDVTNFDVMEGVSATDNSGEEVTITVKSNLSLRIPGDYTITYIATDSSGNVTTKKRIISIFKPFSNGIMTSDNVCITDSDFVCSNGTSINIQVNSEQNYRFYVVKDTGTKLTLIMDRNLVDNVDWINASDYAAANDDKTECSFTACNDEGPLTAIAKLESATNDWTNVPKMTYTYSDENSVYADIPRTGIRARLLTYTEAINADCKWNEKNTCPAWLYDNTDLDSTTEQLEGYWLSTAYKSSADGGGDVHTNAAVYFHQVYNSSSIFGIRPVIELSK